MASVAEWSVGVVEEIIDALRAHARAHACGCGRIGIIWFCFSWENAREITHPRGRDGEASESEEMTWVGGSHAGIRSLVHGLHAVNPGTADNVEFIITM